jgi:LuxR family transcriptional regulator, maltose regulon positive regulatory protein
VTTGWEMGLAATKLRPPTAPAHLVLRSRLDAILDAGIERRVRLVLVSAPAGSGKSTLLASWSAERDGTVAWLQVEASDSDPARFWSYLVDAVGSVVPVDTNRLRSMVVGSNGDEQVVVSALINELTELAGPLVLVVDDYHLIENEQVHQGVERLIELGPPQVTVVLGTRIDPPFRLGRLRVREQLAEVRASDLRFDTDEAGGLLAPSVTSLDRAQLDELCDRTEGWAAGLVLAGLSLARAADPAEFVEAFRGDDQLVVEYLRDELLGAIGDDDRRRLLETSILDQLSGPLVDAVTDGTGGAAWLRDVAGSNQLVIGLDRTGTWYRYHHLLRDLLRLEAAQASLEQLPVLHERAAAWFESEGDHRRAIGHRLAAGDVDRAARLLLVLGPRLVADGQIETLQGLLDQVTDAIPTVPWLALLAGWCAFIGGRYSTAATWLDTLLQHPPRGFDPTVAVPLEINVDLARGDVAAALAIARRMTATDQVRTHTSDLATATGAAYAWAGLADDARRDLQLAAEMAGDDGIHTAHVLALVYRAVVEHDDGSPASAAAAAVAALDTATAFGLTSYHGVAPAYAIRARTSDDAATALTDVEQAIAVARRASTDLVLGYVLTTCGDTLLSLDDDAGAPLLVEARSVLDRCPDPGIAGRALARAESRHGIGSTAPRAAAADLAEPLTDRELAVLRHLPTAMSQRDIAAELFVSLNTVKTHCRAIYRKLGVGDRKAAVQAARDRHLL